MMLDGSTSSTYLLKNALQRLLQPGRPGLFQQPAHCLEHRAVCKPVARLQDDMHVGQDAVSPEDRQWGRAMLRTLFKKATSASRTTSGLSSRSAQWGCKYDATCRALCFFRSPSRAAVICPDRDRCWLLRSAGAWDLLPSSAGCLTAVEHMLASYRCNQAPMQSCGNLSSKV